MSSPSFPVRVEVSGLKAEGLHTADGTGISDAFAVVKVGAERCQTEVARRTMDPVWRDALFVFGAKQDLTHFDSIRVTLWGKDRIGKTRQGEVLLTLAGLWSRNGEALESWRPVYFNGMEHGRYDVLLLACVQFAR